MIKKSALLSIIMLVSASLWAQTDVQKWEPDIRKFEQLDATQTYDPHAIMFVGSSSILKWQTIEQDMKPYAVIQRGFGGSKLTDVNYYLDRIVTPKHQFDALVFFVANDINGGNSDKTPKEVLKLFQLTVKKVRKSHKKEPIFFIEITPTPARFKVWKQQKQANAYIERFCKRKKNLYFISTASKYLDNFKEPRKELFVKDGLHFNPEGYAIWSQLIKTELDKVLHQTNQ